MQFSDTTYKQGIIEDIDFWVNTNTTTYPTADKTRNVNRWLDVVVSDILGADGRWQWDDSNHTDTPIGTTNLVSGQQQYSFSSEWLRVTRVEVKNSAGDWILLNPIDQNDIQVATAEFYDVNATPIFYDVIGENIFLYPASNYNSTGGVKVFFQRKPDYFTASDTTQEPGFAAPFHRILSKGAAYDFAIKKSLPQAKSLVKDITNMRDELKKFYGQRPKFERPRITGNRSSKYE